VGDLQRTSEQEGGGEAEADANRLAHESIREQTRQGGTRRDRETAMLLVRHMTADLPLRSEKALERLRAWCPTCREPLRGSCHDEWLTQGRASPCGRAGAIAAGEWRHTAGAAR
jgi:hypothetical protein